MHSDLRVFVLGDPKDKNAVWPSQIIFADKLRAAGVPTTFLLRKFVKGRRKALEADDSATLPIGIRSIFH